jgi:hypothetical protein
VNCCPADIISQRRVLRSRMKTSDVLVEHIVNTLKDLRYGYVVITVHDSRVVQIDRTEKHRLTVPPSHSERQSGRDNGK